MVINTACNKQFDFIDISEVCNFNYIIGLFQLDDYYQPLKIPTMLNYKQFAL